MSRADKIRAVAQQAHDNGDCVCCLPDEMVEFERAKQTTITNSRDDLISINWLLAHHWKDLCDEPKAHRISDALDEAYCALELER